MLKQAPPDETEAEAVSRRAIDVARTPQARSWELRAATSLAWFTEGFDTGDLREAKALRDSR